MAEQTVSWVVRWSCSLTAVVFIVMTGCGSLGYHRVREGETLYSISWRYGQDYRDVADWNGIAPPYLIQPGQTLRIAPSQVGAHPEVAITTIPPPRPVAAEPVSIAPAVPPARNEIFKWRWPATGPVVRGFSTGNPGHVGIDLAGQRGNAVQAAAPGTVVYSGAGLAHYGNLLIIKHNESYLSAYAHNDRLLVREGDVVTSGQTVAAMGNSGTGAQQVMVHFEIRVDGVPVDPLKYLPPR